MSQVLDPQFPGIFCIDVLFAIIPVCFVQKDLAKIRADTFSIFAESDRRSFCLHVRPCIAEGELCPLDGGGERVGVLGKPSNSWFQGAWRWKKGVVSLFTASVLQHFLVMC